MLLSLLAPLCFFTSALLAANTIIPTHVPLGPLITHERPYHCLTGPQAGRHTLHRPDTSYCAQALDQIIKADKAGAPMLISRTQGYVVPHRWEAGNCVIYINTSSELPTKPVTMPLAAVVQIALVIMSRCVDDGPGLGGSSFLGSWDDSGGILDVILLGRDTSLLDVSIPPSAQVAAALDRSIGSARFGRA